MIINKPSKIINRLLLNISKIKEYKSHIVLPDLHYKSQMEAPSSTAISTGNFIIPSLASAAINDSMSIIKLPFNKEELNDNIIKDIFIEINSHAAKNKFDMNKYSLTKNELYDTCIYGAKAVLKRYNLPNNILDSLELNGVLNEGLLRTDVEKLVPKALLASRFSRAEFGLNFRGNHFLELQFVDKVKKIKKLIKCNIQKNDLTIMTHLGPGPFSGNLMRIYTNREKIPNSHRLLYFMAKSYFHLFEGRRNDLNLNQIIKYFFNPDTYQAYNINSDLGKDFYKLIQISTNVGYAYQLGTFTAVRDAVRIVQDRYNLQSGEVELIWNVSHNSIYKDKIDNNEEFVTRHNSVKIYNQKPTIIAGSFDVPSCIGISFNQNENKLMNTHDHGIGAIISRLKKDNKISYTKETSIRYFYERGTNRINKIKVSNISDYQYIEEIVKYFEKEHLFRPWFYIKPIATLKN